MTKTKVLKFIILDAFYPNNPSALLASFLNRPFLKVEDENGPGSNMPVF